MSNDREHDAGGSQPAGRRSRRLAYVLLGILYLLHNDLWLWDDGRLVAGLPAGLVYHVGFCAAAAVMLFLLVTRAWPAHLDRQGEDQP